MISSPDKGFSMKLCKDCKHCELLKADGPLDGLDSLCNHPTTFAATIHNPVIGGFKQFRALRCAYMRVHPDRCTFRGRYFEAKENE